jgi:hypothetical protein
MDDCRSIIVSALKIQCFCYCSRIQTTINIKKLCSITEFIRTIEVNINHSSCMCQTLEIVIISYQSRPESVYLALVKIAINLSSLLLVCYISRPTERGGQPGSAPGPMLLEGPQAKRGKKTEGVP